MVDKRGHVCAHLPRGHVEIGGDKARLEVGFRLRAFAEVIKDDALFLREFGPRFGIHGGHPNGSADSKKGSPPDLNADIAVAEGYWFAAVFSLDGGSFGLHSADIESKSRRFPTARRIVGSPRRPAVTPSQMMLPR